MPLGGEEWVQQRARPESDYGQVQELEVRVSELETRLKETVVASFQAACTEHLKPLWQDQQARIDRLENAVGALITNPNNPVSAAAQARAALTS